MTGLWYMQGMEEINPLIIVSSAPWFIRPWSILLSCNGFSGQSLPAPLFFPFPSTCSELDAALWLGVGDDAVVHSRQVVVDGRLCGLGWRGGVHALAEGVFESGAAGGAEAGGGPACCGGSVSEVFEE